MTSGSHKGGAFERKCGRLISKYLTGGEDDSQLIRSVSSGGWARRKVRQVGDLAPNGEAGLEFRLVYGVECKNRQEWEWRHFWTSDDPVLLQWWRKHQRECEEADLIPLMIFTRNYEPLYLMFPSILESFAVGDWPVWDMALGVEVGPDGPILTIVTWDELATKVDPVDFLESGRRLNQSAAR